MCFPNKKQKSNFTDETEKRDNGKPTKGPKSPTTPPIESTPSIPPITNNPLNLDMSSPKVAIIIYSMYGHIAKRSLGSSSIIICPYSSFFRYPVAEAEKAGIEKAGGNAEIYQYVSIPSSKYYLSYLVSSGPEWPKPFLKRSSRRCTLRRNPITPSLPLIS